MADLPLRVPSAAARTKKGAGCPAPPSQQSWRRLAPALLRALGHDGDVQGLAIVAGEAGEHRLDQVRDQPWQLVAAAARLGLALEQRLAVAGAANVHFEVRGVERVARHVIAAPEGIVPAPEERAAIAA